MKQIETPRLLLREVRPADEDRFFLMDSNPEVVKFIEPVSSREEVVAYINDLQVQYKNYGIGRWAVIKKSSGLFIGWSGFRYYQGPENRRSDFYDLGYRFMPEYWGNGYATETCVAWLTYGFAHFNRDEFHATTHTEHQATKNVLLKVGFKFIETFDEEGVPADWFTVTREDWMTSVS